MQPAKNWIGTNCIRFSATMARRLRCEPATDGPDNALADRICHRAVFGDFNTLTPSRSIDSSLR